MARRNNNKNGKRESDSRNERTSNSKGTGRSNRESTGSNNGSGTGKYSGRANATNAVLASNVANIDYNWPAGTFTHLSSKFIDGFSVPGLLTLEVAPTIGGNVDSIDDPINRAAAREWQRLRGDKSGVGPYEPCDLAILSGGLGGIYTYLTWLKRLYKIASVYSDSNKYMPQTLIEANWVDFEDLRRHRYELRTSINEMISAIAAFNLPVRMNYFAATDELISNVYTEGLSVRDQMYMFVPAGFYQFYYDDEDEDYRGHLKFVTHSDRFADTHGIGYHTVEQLVAWGWELIESLLTDSDMYQLSADIGNKYSDSELMKFAWLQEEEYIVPVYDEKVLTQIQNSTCIPVVIDSLEVRQSTQNMVSGPVGIVTQQLIHATPSTLHSNTFSDYLGMERILTVPGSSVTVDNVMEFTRFMSYLYSAARPNSGPVTAIGCGSEIITNMYVWDLGSKGAPHFEAIRTCMLSNSSELEDMLDIIRDLALFRSFKFAPITFLYYVTGSGASVPEDAIMLGQVDNYTFVPAQRLARIHDVALLATFGTV